MSTVLSNTKNCKHCQEEINIKAKKCPKCGGKQGIPGWAKLLIVFGVIIFLMVACANACSNAFEETKKGYQDVNGKTSFKLNETFENKYEKITMTEIIDNYTGYNEYLGPADGYKIILVKFEVENIGDDDEIYTNMLDFNAYADNIEAEYYLYIGDDYKSFDSGFGLAKGKKMIGYLAYEVPVDAQKIIIDYEANFWIDDTAIEFIVQE